MHAHNSITFHTIIAYDAHDAHDAYVLRVHSSIDNPYNKTLSTTLSTPNYNGTSHLVYYNWWY